MQRQSSVSVHSQNSSQAAVVIKPVGQEQCHIDGKHNVTPTSLPGDSLSYNVFKTNNHERTGITNSCCQL